MSNPVSEMHQQGNTSRLRLWRRIVFIVLVAAVVGAWVGVEILLPRLLNVPFRAHVDHKETPSRYGIPFENFNVVTADGLTLKGWFVRAMSDKPVGTVVVLHGKSSCKEHMLALARLLAPHGYNAILYDSRANGESGGSYCTYGVLEKKDVSLYLDEAQKRYGPLGPIGIIGTSLGSAVAIQTLVEDERLVCGVICSPFPNLEEAAQREQRNILHFDSPWLLKHVLDKGSKQAGFNVSDINPEQIAKMIRCPVLVIHGEKDERFPVAWGKRVYDSFSSPQKEWYLAKGNGHDDVFWFHDATNVKRHILQFLARNMQDDGAQH